jgi:hypothetical protein
LNDAIARLRLIGSFRREPDPNEGVVSELFVEAAPRMTCPICKEKGLAAAPVVGLEDADDWQAAVLCEICRTPIAPERLEAVPHTKRCATCQGLSESGRLADVEPEFCPHCGSPVEIRVSRGSGITRYKRVCTGSPPCRL